MVQAILLDAPTLRQATISDDEFDLDIRIVIDDETGKGPQMSGSGCTVCNSCYTKCAACPYSEDVNICITP